MKTSEIDKILKDSGLEDYVSIFTSALELDSWRDIPSSVINDTEEEEINGYAFLASFAEQVIKEYENRRGL